jgi:iron complex transport system substrate-binding protein
MNKKIVVPLILLSVLLVGSCRKNEKTDLSATAAVSAETVSRLGIKNAKLFNIDYMANGIKLITDGDGRETLLVPRGAAIPAGYQNRPVVRTPIERGFFMSTTYVGLLDALENDRLFDSIAAVITDEPDWTTPQVLERFKTGQIKYIPWDMGGSGDIESVIDLKTDIVFSGPGDQGAITAFSGIDEMGLNYVILSEYLEESNVASLEWIKFIAAFYNLDEEADTIYEQKLARLDELTRLAANIPENEKPVVAMGLSWQGTVYSYGGNTTTAQEMERAGAIYYLQDLMSTGSTQITMEEFFDKGRNADILIYTSMILYCPDKQALLAEDPLFAEFKAFKNDQVYVLSKGYYMNSAAVDTKFEDVVSIFHPNLVPNHTLTFYERLPD